MSSTRQGSATYEGSSPLYPSVPTARHGAPPPPPPPPPPAHHRLPPPAPLTPAAPTLAAAAAAAHTYASSTSPQHLSSAAAAAAASTHPAYPRGAAGDAVGRLSPSPLDPDTGAGPVGLSPEPRGDDSLYWTQAALPPSPEALACTTVCDGGGGGYAAAATAPVELVPFDVILEDDMVLQSADGGREENLRRLLDGAEGEETVLPPTNEWFPGVLALTCDGRFIVAHAEDPTQRIVVAAAALLAYSNLSTGDGVALSLKADAAAAAAAEQQQQRQRHETMVGGYLDSSSLSPPRSAMPTLVFLRFRSIDSTAALLARTRSRGGSRGGGGGSPDSLACVEEGLRLQRQHQQQQECHLVETHVHPAPRAATTLFDRHEHHDRGCWPAAATATAASSAECCCPVAPASCLLHPHHCAASVASTPLRPPPPPPTCSPRVLPRGLLQTPAVGQARSVEAWSARQTRHRAGSPARYADRQTYADWDRHQDGGERRHRRRSSSGRRRRRHRSGSGKAGDGGGAAGRRRSDAASAASGARPPRSSLKQQQRRGEGRSQQQQPVQPVQPSSHPSRR